MIQLTRTDIVAHPHTIAALREDFERQRCLVLPNFLDKSLLRYIEKQLETARFFTNVHRGTTGEPMAREFCVGAEEPLAALFPLLLNRPQLFQVMQQITGCPTIGSFCGRLYRREADANHYDSWHGDLGEHRLVGMSINLTSTMYTGGIFQLRYRQTQRMLCEVAPTSWGDAHIFRIASHLQHRVTPVEGCIARTAYAGWFCSEPHYEALLQDIFQPRPHPYARVG